MAETQSYPILSTRSTNPEDAITTGLNSLANGSGALGGSHAQTAPADRYISVEAILASITTTSGYLEVWIVETMDGTNYADSPGRFLGTIKLADGTGAKRSSSRPFEAPIRAFKIYIVNRSGAALASSGNTVRTHFHRDAIGV